MDAQLAAILGIPTEPPRPRHAPEPAPARTRHAPTKGESVFIEPLRTPQEVNAVRSVITNPRDRALFDLGVNSALRATDILALRADQIDWVRGVIRKQESKTGKIREFPVAASVLAQLAALPQTPTGLLFASSKTDAPLSVAAYNHLVKDWCLRAGLRGRYGARTIRKTWARIQYEVFGVGILPLSIELNHASERETYRYIGLTPPEQAAIFRNVI